jgi:hypothetical protein
MQPMKRLLYPLTVTSETMGKRVTVYGQAGDPLEKIQGLLAREAAAVVMTQAMIDQLPAPLASATLLPLLLQRLQSFRVRLPSSRESDRDVDSSP